jgi:hypothetical protein
MSLLPDVESLLSKAGYRVTRNSAVPSSIAFEDDSLFGLVVEYDTIHSLREGWKKAEQVFLTLHAPSLRRAAQKAWNCYSVHITSDAGSESDIRSLLPIEEDFKSTRKISRAALSSRKDLIHAFAPLLPLQNVIAPERQASQPDLKERFHEWPAAAVEALAGDATADEILTLLLGPK